MTEKELTDELEIFDQLVHEELNGGGKVHCVACGLELKRFSSLVCSECLDLECEEFLKLAQGNDE